MKRSSKKIRAHLVSIRVKLADTRSNAFTIVNVVNDRNNIRKLNE